ncbi:MAG: nitroreductase family protein [Candidatus Helarchaeota archaeon]|nr:nitroreductase family protein [Candidatus Helarchaeota archaeon]
MTVIEVIETRRSIRRYKVGEIPRDDLMKILHCAQLAPSASNMQPYKFIIIQDPQIKKQIGKMANYQTFISKAAVIIIGLGDPNREKWYKVDLAIAMEHMVLVATELGYGTCWIGAFDEESIKELLKIPDDLKIVALLPIGTSNQSPPARPRKEFNELFFSERFGNQLISK